jgi:peptidyl-prolyl cis-trans isomerase SurA
MHRSILFGLILSIGILTGCGDNPETAALVNGKPVTRLEVDKIFYFRTKDLPQKPEGEGSRLMKLEILRELIEYEIMLQKAEELDILPSDVEVEARLTLMRGPASEEEFQKNITEQGISIDDLRTEIRRSFTVEKVVENQVISKVQVSDEEVESFYEQNTEQFNIQEPLFRIGVIAVSSDPNSPISNLRNDKALNESMALEKIQMLEIRIRAGEDFSQLAREYSEDPQTAQAGGDLGYLAEAALDTFGPSFKSSILSLKQGQVTPVIRTVDGFWVFKLLGRREAGQHDLSNPEVKESLRGELRNQRQQLLTAAFSESIHNESQIENFMVHEVLAAYPSMQ